MDTPNNTTNTETETKSTDFIRTFINEELAAGKHTQIVTRFPPEPNGYLHIGHSKAICISYGIAQEYKGRFHLRFDDTNPVKEDTEYMDAIIKDLKWLGCDWGDNLFYASDYYEKFYNYAVELIKKGKAYVCSLNADEIREYRGTLKSPGKDSPYRSRSIEENLDLFTKMRNGEFEDGAHVLRAKIDMASPNLNMRDPAIYRIRKISHHRTGDKWCIYPMYDFAHCISDAIEGITHSLCSLEFEDHRPLYDWILDELETPCHPRQIEFARLNLTYTIMSKRYLRALVEKGHVTGWDDPRMPTLSGLRRRGYTAESIKTFNERIGIAKSNSIVDIALLEHCLREYLNQHAQRVMAVLNPLKVVITNYPEDQVEEMDAQNNPEDPDSGTRKIPFSRVIYIEKEDFMENPPKKFFRLFPGSEIRLKHAYYIKCENVIKDENGEILELHCTYDPETRGGWSADGRNVKGTSHWVSAAHALDAEVRLYDRLFTVANPGEEEDFTKSLNPNSLEVITSCKVEPNLKDAKPGSRYQFLRQGYFCVDPDTTTDKLVFNRTVSLKDTWAKITRK